MLQKGVAFFYQDQYPHELALHQKYAQSPVLLDLVWTHSCILADICLQLLGSGLFDTSQLPTEVVVQACLLHDIGTYACDGWEWLPGQVPTGRPYIQHMIVGAWMLMKEGFPPPIVQVAFAHKATGITAADVAKFVMPLPAQDYPVTTPLQQLVCYASKHHSKRPLFRTPEEVIASLQKYDQEKVDQFAKWYEFYGPVKLDPLHEKYDAWHSTMSVQLQQLQGNLGHLVV